MSSEEQIMAKAQMNQSWYDAHMKMKRRSASGSIQSSNHSQDAWDITEITETYDASDLRDRIFLVQQQLCVYHDLLDKIEKLKAHNEQLERQHRDLLKECSEHKKKLKKDARSTVRSLENEVVELKLELAQLSSREDVHNARMQDMLGEKETLEEEVKALRLKSLFLSSSYRRGAARDICGSLIIGDKRVKAQVDKPNFFQRESVGNAISAITA
mmetsp:Transcript_2322/g.3251  ORF Transcript_2322/g.3251 Transcript_2322/m.3251 type:complete len:214 (-) Transcript_2322:37-678(-)